MKTSLDEIAKNNKQEFDEFLKDLPEIQQEVINNFIRASKVGTNQQKYSMEYIYESLLMRIKGRNLYDHLRDRKILPLPCINTLNNYIGKLKPKYGFQECIFDDLKLKAGRMHAQDKEGIYLNSLNE